jgi:histone acetyltransferase 1
VILPPYQHKGHGAALYNTLYRHALERTDVAELTVEDPSEAFEDLRDRNDLRQLMLTGIVNDPGFKLNVGTGDRRARSKWEEEKRKENKMASVSDLAMYNIAPNRLQRQFLRLVEMLLLKGLDRNDAMALRAWRLQVKARLFRFNYVRRAALKGGTDGDRKSSLP